MWRVILIRSSLNNLSVVLLTVGIFLVKIFASTRKRQKNTIVFNCFCFLWILEFIWVNNALVLSVVDPMSHVSDNVCVITRVMLIYILFLFHWAEGRAIDFLFVHKTNDSFTLATNREDIYADIYRWHFRFLKSLVRNARGASPLQRDG